MKRNRRNDCLFLKQEIGKQAAQGFSERPLLQ